MPPRPALPSLSDRAPFRVRDAIAEGMSPGRLRRLPNPFHGVRSAREPADLFERALALQTVLRPSDCFSHSTAAALLGMRLPEGAAHRELHVTTLGRGRAIRRPGVIGHVAREGRGLALAPIGLITTDPIETWMDLASGLEVDDLIAMGDGLVARRDPFATMAGLHAAAHWRRAGVDRIRRALPSIRPRTDSWRETMLRLALVRRGIPEPEVNGEVHDERGNVVAHGDLVWRRERLIVEYDGRPHWADERQFAIDIARINRITRLRWRHLRVDKHGLADDALLADIVRAMLGDPV